MSLTSDPLLYEHGTDDKPILRTILSSGININSKAKYLELEETSDTVETYKYYESSSKATLYNTIVITYTTSTKEILASVEWA